MHYQNNSLHFKLPRELHKVERYIHAETGEVTPEATEQMNKTATERAKLSESIRNQLPTNEALTAATPTTVEVKSGDSLTKIIGRQFTTAYINPRLALLSSAYMDKQGREQSGNVHFLDIGDKIMFDPATPGQVKIERKEGSSQSNIEWINIFPQETLAEKASWTKEEAISTGAWGQNRPESKDEGTPDGYEWADPKDSENWKLIPEETAAEEAPAEEAPAEEAAAEEAAAEEAPAEEAAELKATEEAAELKAAEEAPAEEAAELKATEEAAELKAAEEAPAEEAAELKATEEAAELKAAEEAAAEEAAELKATEEAAELKAAEEAAELKAAEEAAAMQPPPSLEESDQTAETQEETDQNPLQPPPPL
ncbi:MAG: hypothetical protein ACI9QC_000047 [Oceanicoccus sp.]|jgi:hypothetical protein